MNLIGLAGPEGVGKSTLAEAFIQSYGGVRLSFATPLKKMLDKFSSCLGDELDEAFLDPRNKEVVLPSLGFSYRQAAQRLGTEWGRALSPNIWTNIFINEANRLSRSHKWIVCDDVRFPNEVETIHNLGGVVLGLSRTGKNYSNLHPSSEGITPDWTLGLYPKESMAYNVQGIHARYCILKEDKK